MEAILPTLIAAIPSSALPIIVVVLGLFYIYRKIGNDRAKTAEKRDADKIEMQRDIEELKADICEFKALKMNERLVRIETDISYIRAILEKK